MICLKCAKLDLRAHPKHAAAGLGRCAMQNLPGVFVNIATHERCSQFAAAPADVEQKRVEWWDKQFPTTKGEVNAKGY